MINPRTEGLNRAGVAINYAGNPVWSGSGAQLLPSRGPAAYVSGRIRGDAIISEVPFIALLQRFVNPTISTAILLLCTAVYEGQLPVIYLSLAAFVFFLSLYIVTEFPVTPAISSLSFTRSVRRLLAQWLKLGGIILLAGFVSKESDWYSRKVMITWFVSTPFTLLLIQRTLRQFISRLAVRPALGRRNAILGATRLAYDFMKRIEAGSGQGAMVGIFDDRTQERLPEGLAGRVVGSPDSLLDHVRQGKVDAIYIMLPRLLDPRIAKLIHQLQDTTVSIYFVPDLSGVDLIQTHMKEINGMPVIALWDTPLRGMNCFIKRASDLLISTFALMLVWPVMMAIAVAIKIDSPGPILFRQRRYGCDGREFMVYKFRTMRVCEDGEQIKQASPDDDRITPIGRILRKTSLDELPQFFNVLQGTMSVVGPRPHAVAHNEQYRRQIQGYMLRHKVKPGITGWAQVNGLRGETKEMDKMKARINYDLDYLRSWSPWLDLWIVLRTAVVVLRGNNAY